MTKFDETHMHVDKPFCKNCDNYSNVKIRYDLNGYYCDRCYRKLNKK